MANIPYKPTPLPEKILHRGTQMKESLTCNESVNESVNEVKRETEKFITELMLQFKQERFGLTNSKFLDFLRDFHSEYDDDWYKSNFTRLYKSFKPYWDSIE